MRARYLHRTRTAQDIYTDRPVIGGLQDIVVDHGGDTIVTATIDGRPVATELNSGCLKPGNYSGYVINSVSQMPDGSLHADITVKPGISKVFNSVMRFLLMG